MIRPQFDREPDETGDGGLFAAIGGAALCVGVLLGLVAIAGGWFAEVVLADLAEWITAAMFVGVLVIYTWTGRGQR